MKSALQYRIESLSSHHKRSDFSSGVESLDLYLHHYAGQDIRRNITVTFVLLLEKSNFVAGYYTLSSTGVDIDKFPQEIAKKLPKYSLIPATLLGRLAIDRKYQGYGLGEILLLDALYRSLRHSKEIASMVMVVDAIDDKACAFYKRYGFIPFIDVPHTLFLTMKKIQNMFSGS